MILEEADLELALTPPTDGSNIKATVVRLTPEDGVNPDPGGDALQARHVVVEG